MIRDKLPHAQMRRIDSHQNEYLAHRNLTKVNAFQKRGDVELASFSFQSLDRTPGTFLGQPLSTCTLAHSKDALPPYACVL